MKTGDVMLDAALTFGKVATEKSTIIKNLTLQKQRFALCTIHRAENVDHFKTLAWIVEELNQVAKKIAIVLPLHPRTKAKLEQFSLFQNLSANIKLIEPVGFLNVLSLQKASSIIITDSGGMQKEAFFKRNLVLQLGPKLNGLSCWIVVITDWLYRLLIRLSKKWRKLLMHLWIGPLNFMEMVILPKR